MKNWADLDPEAQLKLQVAYQAHLDLQPRTCSMDEKIARFSAWLGARDVAFGAADLKRRAPGDVSPA